MNLQLEIAIQVSFYLWSFDDMIKFYDDMIKFYATMTEIGKPLNIEIHSLRSKRAFNIK